MRRLMRVPIKMASIISRRRKRLLNDNHLDLQDTKLTPDNLAGMVKLISDGTISSKMAKGFQRNH